MSIELFETPPRQEMFDEIKRESIKIWETYDDTFGYASGKIESIKNLENVSSNWIYMYQMFDVHNQIKLMVHLEPETIERIREALS